MYNGPGLLQALGFKTVHVVDDYIEVAENCFLYLSHPLQCFIFLYPLPCAGHVLLILATLVALEIYPYTG